MRASGNWEDGGKVCREQSLSLTAVGPAFCCPLEVTKNRHSSPGQFLISPGWNQ